MVYSLVLTSCNRHDLLHRTLLSFREAADSEPRETFIIEDSDVSKPAWLSSLYGFGKVTWLTSGDVRRGQIYSLDYLYSQIKTEWVFHLEDDWLFTQSGFLKQSLDILEKHPEIHTVSLRGDTGWHPLIRDPKYSFKIAEPGWRGGWGGITFNPGMRRLSDYKRIGTYGQHVGYNYEAGCGQELRLSKLHLDMGYRIADLGQVYVQHIGDGRSRAIEKHSSKILIAIPACHKFDYGRWESSESPHYNPQNQAYGADIHISGENPRISTIRDTWWKDIQKFPNVTGRFFYGTPHPREPLADEIFLNNVADNYLSLPRKTIEICKWALAEGYDYLYKCDDDTAVYVDRLVNELNFNHYDYAGCEHSGVCTGGPGYILSRKAIRAVTESPDPAHWAEDCWVGRLMSYANIKPVNIPGHRAGGQNHFIFPNGFDPSKLPAGAVSLHAIQPEVMRDWYKHIHQ